ncbi:MAG: TetR/AcrR family transcriptional repressor of nem operon [Paracoccaceae bacterium]|jgi:TetR/AcrR family transcriptional repressor of nem operon
MSDTDHPCARPGRPRAFDKADALAAITQVFRDKGYEAASLDDLTSAAGLSRSSFYCAFGSKHGALLAAVQTYADASYAAARQAVDDAPDGRAAALRVVRGMSGAPVPRGGCLVINCVSELAPRDPEVAAIVRAHLARYEALIARALSPGAPERSASVAAALLALAVGGLTMRQAGLGDVAAVTAAAEALMADAAKAPAPA